MDFSSETLATVVSKCLSTVSVNLWVCRTGRGPLHIVVAKRRNRYKNVDIAAGIRIVTERILMYILMLRHYVSGRCCRILDAIEIFWGHDRTIHRGRRNYSRVVGLYKS